MIVATTEFLGRDKRVLHWLRQPSFRRVFPCFLGGFGCVFLGRLRGPFAFRKRCRWRLVNNLPFFQTILPNLDRDSPPIGGNLGAIIMIRTSNSPQYLKRQHADVERVVFQITHQLLRPPFFQLFRAEIPQQSIQNLRVRPTF